MTSKFPPALPFLEPPHGAPRSHLESGGGAQPGAAGWQCGDVRGRTQRALQAS